MQILFNATQLNCPFCSHPFSGSYPVKQAGVHTVTCESCRRAFIIHIQKRWWGYQRSTHIR